MLLTELGRGRCKGRSSRASRASRDRNSCSLHSRPTLIRGDLSGAAFAKRSLYPSLQSRGVVRSSSGLPTPLGRAYSLALSTPEVLCYCTVHPRRYYFTCPRANVLRVIEERPFKMDPLVRLGIGAPVKNLSCPTQGSFQPSTGHLESVSRVCPV